MNRRLSRTLLLLLVVLGPVTFGGGGAAQAGSFDLFGFGSRQIAMGGAGTATADDYSAIFYNPANLTIRRVIQLGAEFLATAPALDITLESPPQSAPEPVELDGFTGLGLGVVFPLGGKIDYRLAFGLVLYLPTDHLIQIDALDPLIPRWYVWDSLADKLQILLGLGGRITDWLAVGIGFQSLANIDGGVTVGVDLLNETFPQRDMTVSIINTLAPLLGLRLGPFEGLSVGLSWRAALEVDFQLPIRIAFGEALQADLLARGRLLFTPDTFSLGIGWSPPESPLTVTVDTRYMRWSDAPDPALILELDVAGDLVDSLGLGEAIDFVSGASAFPRLHDAWSTHLGGEYWVTPHLAVRAGYGFRQSPVPQQTSVTNYVDIDSHTIGAGVGLSWPDPLNLDDTPVMFDVTTAYSLMPTQTTLKESPDDPVGPYQAGGGIFSVSASLRHDF